MAQADHDVRLHGGAALGIPGYFFPVQINGDDFCVGAAEIDE
jgi:hypothetical protein